MPHHQVAVYGQAKKNRLYKLKALGEMLLKQLFTLREAEITIEQKGNKTVHTYRIIHKG